MRQTVIELTPMDGGFGPLDRLLVEDPDIQRQTLNQINLLNDGTAVVLCELGGAIDKIEQAFENGSSTRAYQVSETKNGLLAYLHYRPEETTVEALTLLEEHEIIIDMPMEFTNDGGLRLTVFGEESAVQNAATSIPDTIKMTVERTGEYEPNHRTAFSLLTKPQRDTLEVAMQMGYYDVPRRATHEAIAEEHGRTASTIGEQLQRIEKTVFAEITPW